MQAQQEAAQKAAMIKEQRNAVMAQFLDKSAQERLANIAAVKPEKAK